MIQEKNTYLTISDLSKGIFKEKGSKFLAFAYPIKEEKEIKPILDKLKKEYFDARHHCYAYQIGVDKITSRVNDDGEPSGTAGKPILGQIISHNLTNVLVVVVRYFGGILLGTGGLIQAYRGASADAISKASIISKFVLDHYRLEFNYLLMNPVMKIIKDFDLEMYDQEFELDCQLKVKIKKNETETIIAKLSNINDLKISFLLTE